MTLCNTDRYRYNVILKLMLCLLDKLNFMVSPKTLSQVFINKSILETLVAIVHNVHIIFYCHHNNVCQ